MPGFNNRKNGLMVVLLSSFYIHKPNLLNL